MYSLQDVYDAFLGKITEDDWTGWELEEVEADWKNIYDTSLVWFKFPRVSFETDENGNFIDTKMSNSEIQIVANYMKCEWLNRTIMSWENVKPLYTERDFSQANLLDKFGDLLKAERKNALQLERLYYRSVNGKPFSYGGLSGH